MWNLGLTVALGATLVAAGYSGGSYNPSGSGTLPNMGRCNSWIRSDPSADYEQFASERVWVFRKVPDSSFTRTLEWMYLQVEPQPYPLVWNGTIHYQLNNGSTGAFKNNIVYDHGGGHITLYDTDGIYSEAFFLIIIPNRLAFYYICSNIGGDYTTDYRYLATRPGVKLTPQEYSYFQKVETSSRFKNNLIDLPSSGPDLGVLHQSSNTNFCGTYCTMKYGVDFTLDPQRMNSNLPFSLQYDGKLLTCVLDIADIHRLRAERTGAVRRVNLWNKRLGASS